MRYPIEQPPPFAVQIELTEGCNLRCPFCAVSSIRTSQSIYKFLTVENARRIADGIGDAGWTPRIEFGMHGEPTINPNCCEIIYIFRRRLPGSLMLLESNGTGFASNTISRLFDAFAAGLDNLAIEDYRHAKMCARIRSRASEHPVDFSEVGVFIYDYPRDPEGNPHRRGKNKKLIFLADPTVAKIGTHSQVHNSAGLAKPPLTRPPTTRCAKPFRELAIRWDGNVALCCNDWRGWYKIGNVLQTPVEELWQHSAFNAARLKLYHGQRDFGPCNGCDARSYRVGLLPDKFGKAKLPEPDDGTLRTIKRALSGGTYTLPVLREWEES